MANPAEPKRRERHAPIFEGEAAEIARQLGGFLRQKKVNGRFFWYVVKNRWIPRQPGEPKGKVRQDVIAYLGPSAEEAKVRRDCKRGRRKAE